MTPPKKPFCFLLLLSALLGWLATQHGMLFFPDEARSVLPLHLFQLAKEHHALQPFLQSTLDRPLFYLFYTPVSLLLAVMHPKPIPVDPTSGWPLPTQALWVFQIFQTLLLVANTALISLMAQRLFQNRWSGLLTGVLFTMGGSQLFLTRHLFPSLLAETFLLLAIWPLSHPQSENASPKTLVLGAMLWLCQILVYPGFYYTGLLILLLLALHKASFFKNTAIWLGTLAVGILLTEVLGQAGLQRSYLGALTMLSKTLTQGDPGMGFATIYSYYRTIAPVLFYTSTATLLVASFYSLQNQTSPVVKILCLAAWLVITTLSMQSGFSQGVLYSRMLLPLSTLMVLLVSGYTLSLWETGHRQLSGFILAGIFIGLLQPLPGFLAMRFPLDAGTQFTKDTGIVLPLEFLHSSHMPDFTLRGQTLPGKIIILETRSILTNHPKTVPLDCQSILPFYQHMQTVYLILNRQFVYPIQAVSPISPQLLQESVLVHQAYPLNFPLYGFDGLSQQERALLKASQPAMLILKNPCRKTL